MTKNRSFGNFLPEEIEFFRQFPWKLKICSWKNRNFSEICLEKSKFFVNFTVKIKLFSWKNRNLSSISLEKSKFSLEKSKLFGNMPEQKQHFFDPDPRPPDF